MRWHLSLAAEQHGICSRTFLAGQYREAGNGLYFGCHLFVIVLSVHTPH